MRPALSERSRGNALDLYTERCRFEYRLGHLRLFVISLIPSGQISGYYLDYATTASFQIPFNSSLVLWRHLTLCNVDTKIVVK
jgi:hypothetical protein